MPYVYLRPIPFHHYLGQNLLIGFIGSLLRCSTGPHHDSERTTVYHAQLSGGKQEAKLMEHAGLMEKLTMQREGNVLRQWERHQRDWLRVTEDIVAKTGKASTIC